MDDALYGDDEHHFDISQDVGYRPVNDALPTARPNTPISSRHRPLVLYPSPLLTAVRDPSGRGRPTIPPSTSPSMSASSSSASISSDEEGAAEGGGEDDVEDQTPFTDPFKVVLVLANPPLRTRRQPVPNKDWKAESQAEQDADTRFRKYSGTRRRRTREEMAAAKKENGDEQRARREDQEHRKAEKLAKTSARNKYLSWGSNPNLIYPCHMTMSALSNYPYDPNYCE